MKKYRKKNDLLCIDFAAMASSYTLDLKLLD